MTPKPLLYNGKPFNPNPPRGSFLRIAKWLDEHEGVFTGRELRRQRVAGQPAVSDFALSPIHQDYVHKDATQIIYGSPSEMKRYLKAIGSAEKP